MTSSEDGASSAGRADRAEIRMDCTGMRCPQPVLRLAAETAEAPAGTIVEIVGNCTTFERDVRAFCERRKKTLLGIHVDGTSTSIRIQF
jgi:tRNA 2-thiouridine synthesizing protein A